MSLVWNAVICHNGFIEVDGTPCRTSYSVFLPLTKAEESLTVPDAPLMLTTDDYRGNNETLMVVDDLAIQLKVASNLLKRLGYRVFAFSSGEEAVAFARSQPVDLAVLDMVLEPGMSGVETLRELRAITPEIKAVFISGHDPEDISFEIKAAGGESFVQKPADP